MSKFVDEFNGNDRTIALDKNGEFVISTVKLMFDHGFGGVPLWYETMVFNSNSSMSDLYMDRYATKEEALEGHKKAVKLVEEGKVNV